MWSFLARNRAGSALGELRNVHDRNVRYPFLRTDTFTGRVDPWHPLAARILDGDLTIVSGYDLDIQAAPLIQGPVVGYQKQRDASSGNIQFTVAGARWYLDRRIIGQSANGATFGTTSLSLRDRGDLIGATIDALNVGENTNIFTPAGNTTLRRGTITASSSTYVTDPSGQGLKYKNAGEFVNDMTATLDGPDVRTRYVEPFTDATGLVLALIDVAPAIGALQPNVVFAYGTPPGNVASWTDVGDSNTLANRAISLPSGFPDNPTAQPLTWIDQSSIDARGLHETVVAADLVADDLRTKLIQEHVRVRKTPRRVISVQPTAEDPDADITQRRGPRFKVDYDNGDVCIFRAVERFDVTDAQNTVIGQREVQTADLLMRMFAVELAIDDNGVATPTPTLQSDAS